MSRHENASRPCAAGTPPARPLVADADRRGRDAERAGVAGDVALDRGPGAWLEPRLEDGGHRPPIGCRDVDDELVLVGAADPLHADRRTPVRAATSRRRWRSPRKRITAPSRSPPRAASSARSRACRARCRRSHGSRSARNAADVALGFAPSRAGRRAGTVTTTPRSGWITTRRPRDRGDRRSV